jgi:hypothetical protein
LIKSHSTLQIYTRTEPAIAAVTHTRRELSPYARFLLLGANECHSRDAFTRTTRVAKEKEMCEVGESGEVGEQGEVGE